MLKSTLAKKKKKRFFGFGWLYRYSFVTKWYLLLDCLLKAPCLLPERAVNITVILWLWGADLAK